MSDKTRNYKLSLLAGLLIYSVGAIASADTEQEDIYLTQILNQLNAVKPLILAAAREQPKSNRVQFHYSKFVDSSGAFHNGLLEDLDEIEYGIRQKLKTIPDEPNLFKPITGDYLTHYGEKK